MVSRNPFIEVWDYVTLRKKHESLKECEGQVKREDLGYNEWSIKVGEFIFIDKNSGPSSQGLSVLKSWKTVFQLVNKYE